MQKSITTLLLLFSLWGQAQITITGDDMPEANDTLRLSEAFLDSLTRATYLQSGENVQWNFEHLQPLRQTVKEYKRALSTPYGFFFIGFNRYGVKELDSLGFGQFQFRDVYQYFKSDNREFRVEGIGLKFQGVPLPAYYADEDEIYQFPLDYNDRDSSTFSFRLSLPALGSYTSEGYRVNEVDAWGNIKTPFGAFDCIRVVSDIVSTDSIEAAGVTFGLPNVRRSYKWLAKGVEVPILEIEGNIIAQQFIPIRVRYRDIYRNIDVLGDQLAPTVAFEADNLTPILSDTVKLTSNSSDLVLHEWSISPNTYTFVNGTNVNSRNPEVVFQAIGSYDVSLTVSNTFGSADTTKLGYIVVSPLSSTRLFETEIDLKLFPNPASDHLTIAYNLAQAQAQPTSVYIFDVAGRFILSKDLLLESGKQAHVMDVSRLISGQYWIEIRSGQKHVYRSFVVKR